MRPPFRCVECGIDFEIRDWREHTHPGPAPELLAALQARQEPLPE